MEHNGLVKSTYCQIDCRLPDIEINDYDQIAIAYHDAMGKDFAEYLSPILLAELSRFSANGKRLRYLDLGCGSGAMIDRMISEIDVDAYGIDKSAVQIDEARHLLGRHGLRGNLSVGDILVESYPDRCDLISMNLDVLNHVNSVAGWVKVIRKARSALKLGGLLMFDVNSWKRLKEDWNYPEVLLKRRVTYVQCGLEPQIFNDHIRRQIVMRFYRSNDRRIVQLTGIIEQIALRRKLIVQLLRDNGFDRIRIRDSRHIIERKHVFLKNRLFVRAVKA